MWHTLTPAVSVQGAMCRRTRVCGALVCFVGCVLPPRGVDLFSLCQSQWSAPPSQLEVTHDLHRSAVGGRGGEVGGVRGWEVDCGLLFISDIYTSCVGVYFTSSILSGLQRSLVHWPAPRKITRFLSKTFFFVKHCKMLFRVQCHCWPAGVVLKNTGLLELGWQKLTTSHIEKQ